MEKTITTASWQDWYRALKNKDIDLYRKTIGWMESVALNNHVENKLAAEYERTAVILVCESIGVKP